MWFGRLGALVADVMTLQTIKLNRAESFVDANSHYLLSPSDPLYGPFSGVFLTGSCLAAWIVKYSSASFVFVCVIFRVHVLGCFLWRPMILPILNDRAELVVDDR